MNAEQIMEIISKLGEKMAVSIKNGNYTAEVKIGIETDFNKDEQNTFLGYIADGIAEYVARKIPENVMTHLHANYRLMIIVGETKATFIYSPNTVLKDIKKLAKGAEKGFLTACDGCGKMCEKISKCGGCLINRYCGAECAKKAWKNGHKKECKKLADAKL